MEEEDLGLQVAVVARVPDPVAEVTLAVTLEAVPNLVVVLRARVRLVLNRIPGRVLIRGDLMIALVQGTTKTILLILIKYTFNNILFVFRSNTKRSRSRSPRSKSNSRSPAKDKSPERND